MSSSIFLVVWHETQNRIAWTVDRDCRLIGCNPMGGGSFIVTADPTATWLAPLSGGGDTASYPGLLGTTDVYGVPTNQTLRAGEMIYIYNTATGASVFSLLHLQV